jgi:hypothetical protein
MGARIRGLLVLSGVAATLLAGVIAGSAANAQSATCTNPTATLTVSPSTINAGGTITVSASNYTPNTTITFFDNGQQISQVSANAQGSVSGPYTIPATATTGQHTLVGSDTSGKCGSASFTVTGGGTTGTTGFCPAGYVQSGNTCVPSGGTTGTTGFCPAGYVQSGTQCVVGGGGVCPTG